MGGGRKERNNEKNNENGRKKEEEEETGMCQNDASIILKVFEGSIDLPKWPAETCFTVHFTVFA